MIQRPRYLNLSRRGRVRLTISLHPDDVAKLDALLPLLPKSDKYGWSRNFTRSEAARVLLREAIDARTPKKKGRAQ